MIKIRDSPSAEERRKFSMICGEKTTTQQAIDIELKEFSCEDQRSQSHDLPADTTQGFEINP